MGVLRTERVQTTGMGVYSQKMNEHESVVVYVNNSGGQVVTCNECRLNWMAVE